MDYDVVIVGAGPGGSMTAKHLAEKGVNVLLVEKRPEIGTPVRCGEAIGKRGLESMGVKINKKFIARETYGAVLFSPNGARVEIVSKNPNGYVLERKIFDKHLAIEAAKRGATVKVKTYATGLLKNNGRVKGVRLKHFNDTYDVECKVVVGADGIEGKVGRWAGIDTRTKLSQMTSNVQFEMVSIELEDPRYMEFYFGNKVAPKGYVWIFPKGEDRANVGLGMRDPNKTALSYLRKFVDSRKNLRKGSVVEINVGGVPVQGPIEKSVANGVVLVGDSARHIDPLTGGGMYNAMRCGITASEVIKEAIENNDFSEKFLMKYDRRWRGEIGPSLERALKVKNVLEKLNDRELDSLAKVMHKLKFENADIKDISKSVSKMPPELLKFIQNLL